MLRGWGLAPGHPEENLEALGPPVFAIYFLSNHPPHLQSFEPDNFKPGGLQQTINTTSVASINPRSCVAWLLGVI